MNCFSLKPCEFRVAMWLQTTTPVKRCPFIQPGQQRDCLGHYHPGHHPSAGCVCVPASSTYCTGCADLWGTSASRGVQCWGAGTEDCMCLCKGLPMHAGRLPNRPWRCGTRCSGDARCRSCQEDDAHAHILTQSEHMRMCVDKQRHRSTR